MNKDWGTIRLTSLLCLLGLMLGVLVVFFWANHPSRIRFGFPPNVAKSGLICGRVCTGNGIFVPDISTKPNELGLNLNSHSIGVGNCCCESSKMRMHNILGKHIRCDWIGTIKESGIGGLKPVIPDLKLRFLSDHYGGGPTIVLKVKNAVRVFIPVCWRKVIRSCCTTVDKALK
jgi:hypothetical protein